MRFVSGIYLSRETVLCVLARSRSGDSFKSSTRRHRHRGLAVRRRSTNSIHDLALTYGRFFLCTAKSTLTELRVNRRGGGDGAPPSRENGIRHSR